MKNEKAYQYVKKKNIDERRSIYIPIIEQSRIFKQPETEEVKFKKKPRVYIFNESLQLELQFSYAPAIVFSNFQEKMNYEGFKISRIQLSNKRFVMYLMIGSDFFCGGKKLKNFMILLNFLLTCLVILLQLFFFTFYLNFT